MAVNYDDKRFDQVEADKKQAMNELEYTYAGMIGESDKYYQSQIDATKEWANTQSQLQQDQTDFTIEQIEQQKQQAQKDYTKEQSGAYVDWQKQSNQYGVNAEQQAAAGMTNTGFSESSQVSMYNQYQNRVMTARQVYQQAVLNYNNAIKDAQLQNNSALAEIAFQALQTELQLGLEGFQYKNNLILEQANKKVEMDNMYYQRWQDVLNQINTEMAFEEEQRQFNANYELAVKEFEQSKKQWEQEYQLSLVQFEEQKRQYEKDYKEKVRQFNEEIARLKAKDAKEYELEIKQLELQKQQLAEQKRQHDAEMAYKQQQLAEEKRQHDAEMQFAYSELSKKYSSGGVSGGGSGGSGGGSSSGKSSSSSTKKTTTYQTALNYYNKMVAAGKTKAQVLSDMTSAYKNGQLSKADYTKLKSIFNVRGYQY
jgi:hypothetical protein